MDQLKQYFRLPQWAVLSWAVLLLWLPQSSSVETFEHRGQENCGALVKAWGDSPSDIDALTHAHNQEVTTAATADPSPDDEPWAKPRVESPKIDNDVPLFGGCAPGEIAPISCPVESPALERSRSSRSARGPPAV